MPSRAQKLAAAAALVVVTGTIEATQVDISPRITARQRLEPDQPPLS